MECIKNNRLKLFLMTFGIILMAQFLSCTGVFAKPVMNDIGTLGGYQSWAASINEKGQVIGWSYTFGNAAIHGFIWDENKMRDLGSLGGNSYASGINENGQVVGCSYLADNETQHGFIWKDGKMTDLGIPGVSSYAAGINDKGQVVGWYNADDNSKTRGFIWENGKITDLGTLGEDTYAVGINNKGQVIGYSYFENGTHHGFMWENGKMTDLGTLGGDNSEAAALNEKGQVVGNSNFAGKNISIHGFIWRNGEMIDLGTFGGDAYAVGINDKGQVVGHSYNSYGTYAFKWEDGKVTNIGNLGGDYSQATAINENGQVVGWSSLSNGEKHVFIWQEDVATATPTPTATPAPILDEIHVNKGSIADVSLKIDGNTLSSIMNGTGTLIPNVDYKASENAVTISRWYLNYYFTKFPDQNLYLHFNFENGNNSVLTVYTGDTPHVVLSDAITYTLGSGDAKLNMEPNGNFITCIKDGNVSLLRRVDYTFEPSTNTLYIRKGYLNNYFSKTSEPLQIKVSFTGDDPKTVVITPMSMP